MKSFLVDSDEEQDQASKPGKEQPKPSKNAGKQDNQSKRSKPSARSIHSNKSYSIDSEQLDKLDDLQDQARRLRGQAAEKEREDLRAVLDPQRDYVDQKDLTFLAKQIDDHQNLFDHVNIKVKHDLAKHDQKQGSLHGEAGDDGNSKHSKNGKVGDQGEGNDFRSMQQSIIQMSKLVQKYNEERNVTVQQVQYFVKFQKDGSSPVVCFLVMIR